MQCSRWGNLAAAVSERGDTGIDDREASSPGKDADGDSNGSWQDADGDNLSVIQRT